MSPDCVREWRRDEERRGIYQLGIEFREAGLSCIVEY